MNPSEDEKSPIYVNEDELEDYISYIEEFKIVFPTAHTSTCNSIPKYKVWKTYETNGRFWSPH